MSQKIVYAATERNKEPILNILLQHLPKDRKSNVLELSSGTGQHVSLFAKHFPNLTFQPSELDRSLLPSISAYVADEGLTNVAKPLPIDVSTPYTQWNLPEDKYEFIINVNMMHVSAYGATLGLFANCGELLKPGGLLITYGPYKINGVITPQSNVDFDASIRARNPDWGLREIEDLKKLGKDVNIELVKMYDMPANNKTLIWKKS